MSLLVRLHRLISLGVLATLYFGVLTPLALVLRTFGRDPLRLRRPAAGTYWRERGPMPTAERLDRPY